MIDDADDETPPLDELHNHFVSVFDPPGLATDYIAPPPNSY